MRSHVLQHVAGEGERALGPMPRDMQIAELDASGVGFFEQGDGLRLAASALEVCDGKRDIQESVHASGGRIGLRGESIGNTGRSARALELALSVLEGSWDSDWPSALASGSASAFASEWP